MPPRKKVAPRAEWMDMHTWSSVQEHAFARNGFFKMSRDLRETDLSPLDVERTRESIAKMKEILPHRGKAAAKAVCVAKGAWYEKLAIQAARQAEHGNSRANWDVVGRIVGKKKSVAAWELVGSPMRVGNLLLQ